MGPGNHPYSLPATSAIVSHALLHTHRSGSECQTEVPQKLQASQSADDPMSFTQFRTCLQTLLDPGWKQPNMHLISRFPDVIYSRLY